MADKPLVSAAQRAGAAPGEESPGPRRPGRGWIGRGVRENMTPGGLARRLALLASVFLVSFVVLAFEVSLTRVFSALLSYHYAFLAVSGAVCGLGLGGFGWHLLAERVGEHRSGWLALALAVTCPFSMFLLFGAAALVADSLWTTTIILLPFACAGAFLADVFRSQAQESGRLYHADLTGAAAAALAVVPLVGLTGPLDLAFFLGGLSSLAAVCWAAYRGEIRLCWLGTLVGAFLFAAWPLSAHTGVLRLHPLAKPRGDVAKLLIRDLGRADLAPLMVDSEWTAYARTDMMRYPLAEYCAYTLQLFTDGETPSNMTPFHRDLRQVRFLRDDLPYLAFAMSPRERLLSIGPGGGMDLLWGLLAGFRRLDGVEINDSVARLMRRYRRINGDLYHYPGVRVMVEDGRSFIRRSRDRYDLITTSLTQTATIGNLGLALVESYIHTREAFEDYYQHLTPHGRYALVAQSELVVLRGALTALSVMEGHGIPPTRGCGHLLLLGLAGAEEASTPYRYLLVWKKTPLTPEDLAPVRQAVAAGWAVPLYLPGEPGQSLIHRLAQGELSLEQVFASGLEREGVRVNLAPATDDRPFFLDLSFAIPGVLEWFLVGSFLLALGCSLALISRQPAQASSLGGWSLYFGALGAGFMLVEIPLIQKLVLFLGHPTISLAAILFYLLVGAGLGSGLSQRWELSRLPSQASLAGLAVTLVVVAYLFVLPPMVRAFQASPQLLRLAILGLILLPLGVALGIPFPSGLRLMAAAHRGAVPWMWGVNGMMSVVGSTAAAVAAKFIGFSGCLLAGAVIYLAMAVGVKRIRAVSSPPARTSRPRAVRTAPADPRRLPAAPVFLLLAAAILSLAAAAWTEPRGASFATGASDWSPLHRAAFEGDVARVRRLLEGGMSPNLASRAAQGWTPLHEAAFLAHADVVALLLQHGADPNAADARGRRPLHAAAALGDTRVASLLLRSGADPNAADLDGETPLHAAAAVGHPELVRLLVRAGARPDVASAQEPGWTPFTIAALQHRWEAASALLQLGAEVDVRDRDGRTPLHVSAWTGQVDVARYLLSHGADPGLRDNDGKTPLDLARERGNAEVARLLETWHHR